MVELVINDRFEILELIGKGGMASVYKVRDKSLDKIFAAKVLSEKLTQDQAAVKRFFQEAKASSTLDHQNVVSVYESGTTDGGVPYIIMDFLDGRPLNAEVQSQGALQFERAIEIFVQIADAIAHAHGQNLIHRDVKPSNIMLQKGESATDSENGETELVKVLDFGIAKVLPSADTGAATVTQTGEIFGSPLYMSPEQCKGEAIDARSDIYSLGCLMYEAVSGRAAFNAENPFKVMMNHVQMKPEPFRRDVKIPESLKQVIFCCLEKDRHDRYQKMEVLRDDLALIRDGKPPVAVTKSSKKKSFGRNRRTAWAAALAVGIVAAAGAASMIFMTKPQETTVAPQAPKRLERWEGKTLAEWSQEIEKAPGDAELYYNRGMLHDRRDERTNAIRDFSKAIELDPQFIDAYKARAYVHAATNDFDNAREDCNLMIRNFNKRPGGYEARAFVESAAEETEEAVYDLNKSIELSKRVGETPAYLAFQEYQLMVCLIRLGKFDEAIKLADRALKVADPSLAPAILGLRALANCNKQEFDKAFVDAKKATDSPDARSVEWAVLAHCYAGQRKTQQVEEALKVVGQLETFPARAFRMKGEVWKTADKFEQALEDLGASTSLEQYSPGHRQHAVCFIRLNQLHSALDDLERSYKINPRSAVTMAYLASVEEKLGRKADAEKHISDALAKSQVPIVLANAAEVRLHQGDAQQALKLADDALKGDPYLREGFEIRAQVLKKLGRDADATRDQQKAAKLVLHLDL